MGPPLHGDGAAMVANLAVHDLPAPGTSRERVARREPAHDAVEPGEGVEVADAPMGVWGLQTAIGDDQQEDGASNHGGSWRIGSRERGLRDLSGHRVRDEERQDLLAPREGVG